MNTAPRLLPRLRGGGRRRSRLTEGELRTRGTGPLRLARLGTSPACGGGVPSSASGIRRGDEGGA